jgi:hypothetical protein
MANYIVPPVYGGQTQKQPGTTWPNGDLTGYNMADVNNPGKDGYPTPAPAPTPPPTGGGGGWDWISKLPTVPTGPTQPDDWQTVPGGGAVLQPHGGGGGGGNAGPFKPRYLSNLPNEYGDWHWKTFGDQFYQGANDQEAANKAYADYSNLTSTVGNLLGRSLTGNEMNAFMRGFNGYTTTLGRLPTQTDLFNYANISFGKSAAPVPVSYLKVSEV